MITIGLLGPAGAGKTTVAEYLEKHYGARRYAFAGPLKEFTKRVFDLTDEQVYGSQVIKETIDSRYNVSPRWLLQRIGTQGFRETFGKDFWVELLTKRLMDEDPRIAVVEDVRFINEVYGLQEWARHQRDMMRVKYPCFIWRLEAPYRETTADATHQSEAEWAMCPFTDRIKPDARGLDELYSIVDKICESYDIMKQC